MVLWYNKKEDFDLLEKRKKADKINIVVFDHVLGKNELNNRFINKNYFAGENIKD